MDPFVAACRAVPGVPVPEAAPADGPGRLPGRVRWIRAGDLSRAEELTALFAATHRAAPAAGTVGEAVALAQGLAYAVMGPSVAGAAGAGLVLDLCPAGVWFGFGAQGFCERLAVRPLTVVAATEDFEKRLAEAAVAVLEPVFDQVHHLTRVGRRVLWAAVADSVHQIMLSAVLPRARALPGDRLRTELEATWGSASAVVDALAARAATALPRPRPFPVADETMAALWLVRGGCCFVYRGSGHYCVTCPIIDDDVRRTRLLRWLRQASGAGT